MAFAVTRSNHLRSILNHFPTHSTLYVFGHGPSVVPVCSSTAEPTKVSDVMFVVDDPLAWHESNLSMNPGHYSFLKYFGPSAIARIQDKCSTGVYTNPAVAVDNMPIRYGVISAETLNNHLQSWKNMYAAGKLQTPVLDIKPPVCADLINNLKCNQLAALHAVLMQLPPEASKYELYYGISSLSHSGDFRVYIDEDTKNLKAFVSPLMQEFDNIYVPLINSLKPLVTLDKSKTVILQKDSFAVKLAHLQALPSEIQVRLARRFKYDLGHHDVEEAVSYLAKVRHVDMYVLQTISSIVSKSRRSQVLQDLLTSGFRQSPKIEFSKELKIKSENPNPKLEPINSVPVPPDEPAKAVEMPEKNSNDKKTHA